MRPAAAVIGLLCALAVLVLAAGSGERSRTGGPVAGDMLRSAKGTIWWVDRGCRIEQLRLATVARVRGGAGHCHVWPSPSGQLALATQDNVLAPSPALDVVLLAHDGLHSLGVFDVRSDAVSAGVAWAPDSSQLAFCARRGSKQVVWRVGFSQANGAAVPERRLLPPLADRCQPAFQTRSTLVSSDGRRLYVGSRRVPVSPYLSPLPVGGPLDADIRAMIESPLGLSVAVSRRLPHGEDGVTVVAAMDLRGHVGRIDPLPRGLVDAIGVSRDGAWMWVQYAIAGQTRLLPLSAAALPREVPGQARGYAFSPDAHFVAVALPGELRLVDLRSGRSTSIAAVDPTAVAWTR